VKQGRRSSDSLERAVRERSAASVERPHDARGDAVSATRAFMAEPNAGPLRES
jgi:hypothetical protein